MTAEEIREAKLYAAKNMQAETVEEAIGLVLAAQLDFVAEIAAQLAELNGSLKHIFHVALEEFKL